MNEKDRNMRLHRIVETLFEMETGTTTFSDVRPPFDITSPSHHSTKKEFERELSVVQEGIKHLEGLRNTLVPQHPSKKFREMRLKLSDRIDASAREKSRDSKPEHVLALIEKNMADTSYFINSVRSTIKLHSYFKDRLQELNEQSRLYWSAKNRPADPYPRAIALRLARLYAQVKREKPTIGTARDGGHPSTPYGRSLAAVFEVLGIKGEVIGRGEWAIQQLTEADYQVDPTKGCGIVRNVLLNDPPTDFTAPLKRKSVDRVTEQIEKSDEH